MAAFNLTAQLNITGPNNLRPVIANIRRQIASINPNINLNINASAINSSSQLSGALQNLNRNLGSVAASANTATDAINRLSNAMRSVNTGDSARQIAAVNSESNRLERQQARTSQSNAQAADSMKEFGKQSALAIRRFAAFTLVTGIIYKFTNALASASSEFMKFNKELVRVSQVTGTSVENLSSLTQQITQLSTSLGVSSTELIGVSSTLAQAGLTAQQTEQALKALALSSLAPSFNNMNETVEGSIALMRQFAIETSQLESVLGSINAVAAKFAVEADDIIIAIQRTGGVFAASSKGIAEGAEALNQFIALFTSVRATTRESAETIATGLRTIFTRIQRTETIELLKQFGIQLTDLEGKFVGPYEAVKRLSQGLSGLDTRDIRFSSIIEELGGFRQVGKVIPLLQQFSVAQQALNTAQRGQGSLTADAAKAQQALAIQMAKVQEEFIALVRKIGSSNEFQTMVKVALDLSSALIKIADSAKYALPAIGAMLAMKGTIGAVRFASGFASGMRRGGGARGMGDRLSGAPLGFASGGQVDVPVALEPGEMVFVGGSAKKAGYGNLRRMNRAGDRANPQASLSRAGGGGVFMVPGSGRGDTFKTSLPEGSFVIKRKSVNALGASNIAQVAAEGGQIRQKFSLGNQEPIKRKRGRRRQSDVDNDTTIAQLKLKGDVGLIAPPQKTKTGPIPSSYTESASSFRERIGKEKANRLIGDARTVITYGTVKASTIGDERNLFGEQGGILNKSLAQLDKDIAAELSASGLGGAKSKVSNDANAKRVLSGFAFESFVSGLTQEIAQGEQEPFDFILPSATKLGKYAKVDPLAKYLDAKPNSGANIRAEIIKKSLNYMGKYGSDDLKLQRKKLQSGGLVQRFGRGSKGPLKAIDSMGRSELIKAAQKYKIPFDYNLLGLRTLDDSQKTVKAKFLADLKEARILEEQALGNQQQQAAKKEFGVIGLRGTSKTSFEKTPALRATKGGKKAFKSKDITVSRATLPPYLSKRLEAIARKGYRETVANMATLLGDRAGTGAITDKKQLNAIIKKTFLGGALGQMFEASVAATGSPYPTGKSNVPMDLPRGIRSGVSSLFLDESGQPIKDKIPTDVTVDVDENKYAQMGRFLRDKREARRRRKAMGGFIQRLASGGVSSRNVGYIDSDVLNDPANKKLVDEEIAKLKKQGINITDGYRGYKKYLSDLASQARTSGQLSKLTSIVGLPGAGKSTLMLGNERSDNAKLRKTTRFPIISPSDIGRSSSILDVSATVDQKQIEGSLAASDRVVALSSSTKEEQGILRNRRRNRNRQIRQGTSKTGFGRRAGTTDSAPLDSGYAEALLQAGIDPKKIATLGLTESGFRRKKGMEIPKIIEENVNLFYGNMQGTKGHVMARDKGMEEARKRGATRSIVAIGADTPIDPDDPHSQRSLLTSQRDRLEMGKRIFKGSDVIPATKDQWGFGIPKLFDVGQTEAGQRLFVKPKKGSTATVGDEKGSDSLRKYTDSGLDPIVLPRLGGISGTQLRQAILDGDMKAIKKLTTPEGFQYLTEQLEGGDRTRMGAMQARSTVLPKILERVSGKSGSILSAIEQELGQYPSRLTPKYKTDNPEAVAKIEQLRKQRDKARSTMASRPGVMMRRLGKMFPAGYGMATGGQVDQGASYSWKESKSFYDSANSRRTFYDVFKHDPEGGASIVYSGSMDDVSKFLQKTRKPIKKQFGGEIPIMAQEGEFVINKHAAGQIGHSNLRKLNRGGKVALRTLGQLPKYHSGGSVQRFAVGGKVGAALDAMSPRDAAKLRNTIASNAKAFEKLEQGVQNWPVEAVQAAMKKMARSIEKGQKNFEFNPNTYNQNNPSQRTSAKERVGPSGEPGGNSARKTRSGNFEANRAKTVQDLQDYETQKYQQARKAGKTTKEAREYSRSKAIEKATTLATPMSEKEEKLISGQAYGRARESGASKSAAKLAGAKALDAERERRKAQTQGAAIFGEARMTGQKPQDVLANAPRGDINRSGQDVRNERKKVTRTTDIDPKTGRNIVDDGMYVDSKSTRIGRMAHGFNTGFMSGGAIGGAAGGLPGALAGSIIGGTGGLLAGSIDERTNRIQAQKYESASMKLGARASSMAEGGNSGSAIVTSLNKAFAPLVSTASKAAAGMAKLHNGAASLAAGLSKAGSGAGSALNSLRNPGQALSNAMKSVVTGMFKLGKGVDSAVGSLMGMKKVDAGGGKQVWKSQGNGIMGRVGSFFGMGGGGDMGEDGVTRDAGGKRKRGFGGGRRGGGGGMGMGGMMAEMAVSMAGSAIVDSMAKGAGGEKTKEGREIATVGGSAMSGAAMGMMMGSMLGPLGMAAGAAIGGGAGYLYGQSQMPEIERQAASQKRAETIENARSSMSKDMAVMQNTNAPAKTRAEAEQRMMNNFNTIAGAASSESTAGAKKKERTWAEWSAGVGPSSAKTVEERVASAQPASDAAKEVLMAKMQKTGQSLEELEKSMPASDFNKLRETIALTDTGYQSLLEAVHADGKVTEQEAKTLQSAQKAAMERQSADLKAAGEAAKVAEENARLQQAIRKLSISFDKSAQNMLNATSAAQSILTSAATNIATIDNPVQSAMAGATAGAKERDILSNPNAYSTKEVEAAAGKYSGLYGQDAGAMVQAAVLPRKLEASFGAAMVQTRTVGGDGSKSDTEARGAVKNAIMKTATDAFGPDIADGMRENIQKFIDSFDGDIRTLDFNTIMSQIPEFANGLAASEKALESFKAMAELSSNAMRMQAEAAQAVASKNQEIKDIQAQTFGDVANSTIAFKKAIGEKVSWQTGAGVRNQARAIRMGTSAETASDPQAMLQRWKDLGSQREAAMTAQQNNQLGFQATQPGAGDQAAVDNSQNLARSTAELAQAQAQARQEIMNLPNDIKENMNGIMEELQTVLQERAAKINAASGFMEKVLTSTPKDLRKMGDTFSNLSRTLNGQGVSFQESKSANVAYQQVRNQGGSHMQAQRAAQEAYAQESGDTLSMAKELAPLLGAVDPDAQSKMMGSVYESMFAARGMDTSKMMVGDKSMKDYIEMMKQGAGKDPKVEALNNALSAQQQALVDASAAATQILQNEQQQILAKTGEAILSAINEARVRFDESQLEAIRAGIDRPGQGNPPGTMSSQQTADVKAKLDKEIKDNQTVLNDPNASAEAKNEAKLQVQQSEDARRLMNNQELVRGKDETDEDYERRKSDARQHIDNMGVKGLAVPKPQAPTPPVKEQVEGPATRPMTPEESIKKYGHPFGKDQVPNENHKPTGYGQTPPAPQQPQAPRITGFANGQPVFAGQQPQNPAQQPVNATQATQQVSLQQSQPKPQVSQDNSPMTYNEMRYQKQQQYLSRFRPDVREKVVASLQRNNGLVEPSDRQRQASMQQQQNAQQGQVPGALPNTPPQTAPRTSSTYTTPQPSAGQPVPAPRVVAQPTAQNPSGGVLPTGGFDAFASKLDTLLSKLAEVSIPSQITLTGSADVNIRLNGAEVLAQLPDSLRKQILQEAGQQLANYDKGTTGEGSAQSSNIMGKPTA